MFHGSSKWLRRILTDGRPLIHSNENPLTAISFGNFLRRISDYESLDKGDFTFCATFSYKNKTSSAILSSGTIYLVCSFNFDVLRRNTASASKFPFACYSAECSNGAFARRLEEIRWCHHSNEPSAVPSHLAMWYSWTKTCVVTTDMKSLRSYFCFVSSISVFFKRKFL